MLGLFDFQWFYFSLQKRRMKYNKVRKCQRHKKNLECSASL